MSDEHLEILRRERGGAMTSEVQAKFRRAQWRFILCSMIAYAFFYVTRKNLSMAQPGMLEEGVISTYALGTIMTVHGVL